MDRQKAQQLVRLIISNTRDSVRDVASQNGIDIDRYSDDAILKALIDASNIRMFFEQVGAINSLRDLQNILHDNRYT
jgi:hypothetical protein